MGKKTYYGQRNEIVDLIPDSCKKILDVGCGTGILGRALKHRNQAIVHGIEINQEAAQNARQYLDEVYKNDVTAFFEKPSEVFYDCIIFADILEHLVDPWSVLAACKKQLSPGGIVVISVPNIKFHSTFYHLLVKSEWPYHQSGVHDKTHLRFFTKKNVLHMIDGAGLQAHKISRYYLFANRKTWLNRFQKYLGIPGLKDFFTFQILAVATVKKI